MGLRAAAGRGIILGSWLQHLHLPLGLSWLLLLMLGRWQGCVLGLVLVVGHPVGQQAVMLRLLVRLRLVAVGMDVLLWRLLQGLRLLVMLRRRQPWVRLTLVASKHAVGVITHLLGAGVIPVPVRTPSVRHVRRARYRGLVGAFNAPVQLVLSVTLEVVLWLRLGHPGSRLLLVHPRAAHGGPVLRVAAPQVVVARAALVVVTHMGVRSCGRVGARHAGPVYSSGAVHIHFAIHICGTPKRHLRLRARDVRRAQRGPSTHSCPVQGNSWRTR